MMKRKKILQWIVLIVMFLIISFYFIKIVTYMMHPIDINLENIAGLYGEKKNSLDMVYIGGSACHKYYYPLRAFENDGIASYNYSAASMQPELYIMMIKEILKTQKPELIVIDARAFQYRKETLKEEQDYLEVAYRRVLTGMHMSKDKAEFIENNIGNNKYLEDNKVSYYFDLIKYHRDTKENAINDQIKMAFNLYQNQYKGADLTSVVEMQPINERYNMKEKEPITNTSEKILIDLLRYIKTTDCKYLFVVSPYMEQENEKKNFNYIEKIINEWGYNFLDTNDFYEELNINFETDFYDHAHVNVWGAEKYTDFLGKYIERNYKLPNRKEEYQDWNNLLPNWNEQVRKIKSAN